MPDADLTPIQPPRWKCAPTDAASSKAGRVLRWLYYVTAMVLWFTTIILGVVTRQERYLILAAAMVPLAFPVILMTISWQLFGLAHSALGWRARTGFPRQAVIRREPTLKQTFWFFPEGVGIRYHWFGDVFVPYEKVQQVCEVDFQSEIWHTSPEIRSPIRIPRAIGTMVYDAVQQMPG
jgi:hypothetical protein